MNAHGQIVILISVHAIAHHEDTVRVLRTKHVGTVQYGVLVGLHVYCGRSTPNLKVHALVVLLNFNLHLQYIPKEATFNFCGVIRVADDPYY